MCAILTWRGSLPKGLLSRLLIAAQIRGRDSTGLAWRDQAHNQLQIHKVVDDARSFVSDNPKVVKEARMSKVGLGHTRRASPGMPINADCAHPFVHEKLVYAHNGFIKNWKTLDSNVTSDSQVLGARLWKNDFSDVVGEYALVWLRRDQAYCMRMAKVLVGIVCGWQLGDDSGMFTLAVSTEAIFLAATKDLNGFKFEYELVPLDEEVQYRLTDSGFDNLGPVPVNPACRSFHGELSAATDAATEVDTVIPDEDK